MKVTILSKTPEEREAEIKKAKSEMEAIAKLNKPSSITDTAAFLTVPFQVGQTVEVCNSGEIDGNNCSLSVGDRGIIRDIPSSKHLLIEFTSGIKEGNTQKYLTRRFKVVSL